MITIKVPAGESLEIGFGEYTIRLYQGDDGKVEMHRWVDGSHRELKLDPREDAIPLPHPNTVPLDRNLTVKRLPPGLADGKTMRVIVWEQDAETGARSILDIVEGYRDDLIRCFNGMRKGWIEQGAVDARVEVVRDLPGGH